MPWTASAPSNIALVKYMGKETGSANQAVNPSLSMTLAAFRTQVEISRLETGPDRWEPLPGGTDLRAESTKRFVDFFTRIKMEAGISDSFLLRSANNFPADAGLASSASSFAALTMAATKTFAALSGREAPSLETQARLSRTGSGSSCRSFFSPWCAWEGESVAPVPCRLPALTDLVAVADTRFKKVSSSEAHRRVATSPLYAGRAERARQRQGSLKSALAEGQFRRVAEIAWAELWDMHSLFHTSEPPFFYFAPATLTVLRWAEDSWETKGRGPITTIDAGANVHVLVPTEEKEEWRRALEKCAGVLEVLESPA